MNALPLLPSSWSQLSWQQLTKVWTAKQRYGGNADVARVSACLSLTLGEGFKVQGSRVDERTGETVYILVGDDGRTWTVTPRELSFMAKQSMAWFDFPYGDPGEPAEKDKKGKVVKEARDPVRGYVSPMRDALMLNIEQLKIGHRWFALPQVACNNLTWRQYRSLQAIAPQLFAEGVSDSDVSHLQAQFLAHILTPRSIAILDTTGGSIRLRLHYEYRYDEDRAEKLGKWFERRIASVTTLFHICFQAYQTAIAYYAAAYPLLFQDSGKNDQLRDALQGEVGTINTIMKYAGYAEQQQVYGSSLPFIMDILNTMTKEAKEIEKMNSKIKRK